MVESVGMKRGLRLEVGVASPIDNVLFDFQDLISQDPHSMRGQSQ